ncbi:DegV family EDD domain-containing protein [Fusobacterium necrophorum]|uniref:DAK2 domain fusion protein YloV n=3 Tax=Fusobacterium necrophorum TaxID=859 RepID=A0AAN3VUD5_9FUSO|nr:DegV family EDD domain-containing protein [Fusobacterium necrophorum]AVQ21073.1 DegV family EDD domain-containing protein [Fusobacterium necrophorum subsp. funduliforme]AYV92779.1 DegV family EDD domain-containing protein [Fusobacterium necrophorum subsp. funduliforme]AYV94854.1 DegV family EDD domain-containing protein [Fusobacterium necrophorum subsp. funduliforme]EFS23196.1 DAK2 domain fusion protein YloV [Fusobacterium necrophorum D12]EJU15667.1 DAK2 domain fusion protein YloV [Fusobact
MKIEIKSLNAVRLTKLFIAASRWLSKYADVLNDLNVYPVPDGDTGTNMSMTLQAVENELVKLDHEPNMKELSEIVSENILLGARGNSGTILSQIIQGFLSVVENTEEISIEVAAKAFMAAKDKAYQAVSQPVEGTILTVIRKVAEAAMSYQGPQDDFILFLVHLKNIANEAVENTPNELAKLKEAGVVDAGGKGIFYVLEGFEKSVTDPEMLKDLARIAKAKTVKRDKMEMAQEEEITFKYCTEFIIENGNFPLEEYKSKISPLGDSMVCAQTAKKTKTHIHTNHPGQVLEIAAALGNLNNIKIENMLIQHRNLLVTEAELSQVEGLSKSKVETFLLRSENATPIAYFAIVDNIDLGNRFLDDGATAVLVGGQTKNPSVSDIETGLKKIHAKTIIILPNNKNIISSAKMAAERSEKEVIVFETKSMLEGHYVVKHKEESMEILLQQLTRNYSIEITKASRNTKVDDLEIEKGDCIALVNGRIVEKAKNNATLIKTLYARYLNRDSLSIFAVLGKDKEEEGIKALKEHSSRIRYQEFEAKQENYPYYIYVEQRDPNLPRIAIVTDSASDLTPELMKGYDIHIIPLRLKIGDKNYEDGVTITRKEFWNRILREKILPKTSQPSPAELHRLYQNLFDKGYESIITILLSSKLSGTQQAAKIAKEMIGNDKEIYIVDSKAVTFAEAHQVLEAARLVKEGASTKAILERLYELQDQMKIYFAVNDISYLQKGGRIGRASSIIGGLLKVKPILKLEDGEVTLETKVIGERGALSYMEKLIKNEGKKNSIILYTAWGGSNQELHNADILKKTSEDSRKIEHRSRFEIGPTIGSHSGPVYGFGMISKIR